MVIDDDNEDSSDNNDQQFDELSEEEVEADDDLEEDQDSDGEQPDISVEPTEEHLIDNWTNLDYINALKSGEIPFCEISSFPTVYFQNSSNGIIGIKRCMLFNKKVHDNHRSIIFMSL